MPAEPRAVAPLRSAHFQHSCLNRVIYCHPVDRVPFDLDLYEQRVRSRPCFICAIVAGDPAVPAEIVWRDDSHVAFLAEFPHGDLRGVVLRGHVLLAPAEHREQVVGDFSLHEYVEMQKLVYRIGRAITTVTPTERIYVLSLGSNEGNAHVHWHVAPLPPGVPYRSQQYAALMPESAGLLELDRPELRDLAQQIHTAMEGQARDVAAVLGRLLGW